MAGETDLATLLGSMQPTLDPSEFVFCCMEAARAGIDAIGTFRERDGLTVICRREEAERHGLRYTFPCRMITLNVHSSLDAVGFLAAIASEMAHRGIAVNAVSAYYHDHLFVAVDRAAEAMEVLAAQASASTGVTGS